MTMAEIVISIFIVFISMYFLCAGVLSIYFKLKAVQINRILNRDNEGTS
jgi:hypothetical protein